MRSAICIHCARADRPPSPAVRREGQQAGEARHQGVRAAVLHLLRPEVLRARAAVVRVAVRARRRQVLRHRLPLPVQPDEAVHLLRPAARRPAVVPLLHVLPRAEDGDRRHEGELQRVLRVRLHREQLRPAVRRLPALLLPLHVPPLPRGLPEQVLLRGGADDDGRRPRPVPEGAHHPGDGPHLRSRARRGERRATAGERVYGGKRGYASAARTAAWCMKGKRVFKGSNIKARL